MLRKKYIMKCKNLKQKFNRTLFCKKKNKTITFKDCNNCKFKEYKEKCTINNKNCALHTNKTYKMHNKSANLSKLERNRFSIIYPNKNKCCLCPNTTNLTWHEIYRGRNRQNSMKYGLCLRLCIKCHELYQENKEFNDYWHKKGQLAFMKSYPDLDFIRIFKTNYLGGVKNEKQK